MDLSGLRLAILGTGNMGEAILAGALRAGVKPANITGTTLDTAHGSAIAEKYGINMARDNKAAVRGTAAPGQGNGAPADVVIIAVKPKDVPDVLARIGDHLTPQAIVVSVAVGLSTQYVADRLPPRQPVIRVMPNTPAAIGAGVCALTPGEHASAEHAALVTGVFAGTGDVVEIPESLQAAAGALSGSGPAYVFYVIDAMIEAGVAQGIPRPLATRLAVGTVLGSARLIAETGEHPAIARERVTSPGGTTAAALRTLDARAVRAAIIDANDASVRRTLDLAAALDH